MEAAKSAGQSPLDHSNTVAFRTTGSECGQGRTWVKGVGDAG